MNNYERSKYYKIKTYIIQIEGSVELVKPNVETN